MNQAEVLCHSSGPWKKHKYFQKIGEGANAVYKYSKKAITGSDYKEDAEKYRNESNSDSEFARGIKREAEAGAESFDISKERALDEVLEPTSNGGLAPMRQRYNAVAERAAYNGRKAAEAESNYYNKSLFGKTEKTAKQTVAKGEKLLKEFFSSKTTVTVTSNLMPAGTKKTIKKN